MAVVRVRVSRGEHDTNDDLIRRFKKAVMKAGIMEDVKKHEFFMKKSLKLKEKQKKHRILMMKSKKK